MARDQRQTSDATDGSGMRNLWRLAAWGGGAAVAMAVVVLAQQSDIGGRRLVAALSGTSPGPAPVIQVAAPPNLDIQVETRRLAENVRTLAADRDRLLTRLAALERNLVDMTGSIGRLPAEPARAAAPAPAAIQPPLVVAAPPPAAPAPAPQAMLAPAAEPAAPEPPAPIPIPIPRPAAADAPPVRVAAAGREPSVVTRTEFGVDLGRATSTEGLRTLWDSLQAGQETSFRGLKPLMASRNGSFARGNEMRLVAGPFANASAAAKLCAELGESAHSCLPARYEGRPLPQ